ncbi:MAG: hypothetical protein JSW06_09280 [Thermoplasmatales archaeon]|nr:MAG: hypothetical protein JSW06_09280 [Thermoplasmatales archaeon]
MKYRDGDVFCPIYHKRMVEDDDIERGFHFHCEKLEVFCKDDEKKN